jgi:pimeloyl-ACP methyl ester carboxylesterase
MGEIPTTHYVKSDGIHIAYQVLGEGSFDLLFVPGFVSNVEATWGSPDLSAFFRRLASFCRVILFDKRGTGMSDRGSQIFTLEQRMHDVQAILDAVGSHQAALFGVSEGGPMSLLYAASYPQRTSALVLYGSYAKRSWAPDYPFGWNDEQWQRVLDDIEHKWGTPQAFNILMRVPSAASDRDAAERIASYLRASASPGAAAAIMRMNREIDVRHVLPAMRDSELISSQLVRSDHKPNVILAGAQSYPTRAIHLIEGFGAGGSTRHRRTPDGSMACGATRPAIRHRGPARRERQYRH